MKTEPPSLVWEDVESSEPKREMPQELTILSNDISDLHFYLEMYTTLFQKSPERIALLNDTAPSFFIQLQRMMKQYLILGVGKLTEGPTQGNPGNRTNNLVLRTISDHIQHLPISQRKKINKTISDICKKATVIRIHRHKYVAHRDKNVALREDALESFKISDIKQVIDNAWECIRILQEHYCNSDIENSVGTSAKQLVNMLKFSVAYSDLIREEPTLRTMFKNSRHFKS